MKVFISWSKARSRHVAEALRDWLPCVLQNVQPFISHQDIQKGTRGMARLADELEESSVGIIVLTPENHAERWILFEAGALSKIQRAYVCTYLVAGLAPSDIPSPLGQFQHTRADREDTRAMVTTINAAQPEDRRLPGDRFAAVFDKWWPDLEAMLENLPAADAEAVPKPSTDAMLAEIIGLLRATPTPAKELLSVPLVPTSLLELVRGMEQARVKKAEPKDAEDDPTETPST